MFYWQQKLLNTRLKPKLLYLDAHKISEKLV